MCGEIEEPEFVDVSSVEEWLKEVDPGPLRSRNLADLLFKI